MSLIHPFSDNAVPFIEALATNCCMPQQHSYPGSSRLTFNPSTSRSGARSHHRLTLCHQFKPHISLASLSGSEQLMPASFSPNIIVLFILPDTKSTFLYAVRYAYIIRNKFHNRSNFRTLCKSDDRRGNINSGTGLSKY